ncbi:thioesterase II family protein [Streptomyces sp. NPDC016309]|uniref:thioesterase II family protein n=1 Tax=Streptomyces sp. NPDC016309 TaxID=3364965 RepID=UPI003702E514
MVRYGLTSRDRTTDPARSWLRVPLPRHRPALRLVCFPPAGTTADFYRAWPDGLADHVELAAVQYPARGDRRGEAMPDHLEGLARPVAEALAAAADAPPVLFGHGMGAAVAFETARLLARDPGSAPRALFVSAHPAPMEDRPREPAPHTDEPVVAPRHMNSTRPEDLPPATVHADLRLADRYRYRPGPPLDCPLTAIVGTRDTRVTARHAAGWRHCTTGPFTLRAMPGDHFYLVPRRTALVAFLLTSLGARGGPAARPAGRTAH